MDEKTFSEIIHLITQTTGIIPRDSHKTGILHYINKRSLELKKREPANFSDYYNYLRSHKDEIFNLINNATVNETYFFREEAQFNILKEKIFPEIAKKNKYNSLNPLKIWSAAASSGEEIYSLYLLFTSLGIECDCTASDINTKVLDLCAQGLYNHNSCRSVDGSQYHYLLEKYKEKNGKIQIPENICKKIHRKQINLAMAEKFPLQQDIIFLRNVFIYFSQETKKRILQKIVSESLAPDGYLFVSMNEIASIDASIIPPELEKLSDGKVYYFHKKI